MVGRTRKKVIGVVHVQERDDLCSFCFDVLPLDMNIYGDVISSAHLLTMSDGSFAKVCQHCFDLFVEVTARNLQENRRCRWEPRPGVLLVREYLSAMRREVVN
jgi:hypothetical protein